MWILSGSVSLSAVSVPPASDGLVSPHISAVAPSPRGASEIHPPEIHKRKLCHSLPEAI